MALGSAWRSATRVSEMLRQYVRASHGKLTLTVVNPQPDTPQEEKATAAGLTPQIHRFDGGHRVDRATLESLTKEAE